MAGVNENRDTDSQEEVLRGWDKGAFWYPTLDRRGALLGLFFVLVALHFNEIFGLHTSTALVFGWLPVNMAYYVGTNVLHVLFLVLIYLNWPDPADEDIDRPGVVAGEEPAAGAGAAEGD